MKKLSRQEAIYRVALAGISAAVALLFVGLSVLVRYSTIAFYVAAGLALMVPLSKRYYLSGFFAYAASAALGFLIAGDIFTVIGYVLYFGPAALLAGILFNSKLKWYFALLIKAAFINSVLAVLYFALGTFILDAAILSRVPYWALAIIGTVALLAIDAVQTLAYRRLIPLVDKALRKVGRSKGADEAQSDHSADDDDDPFELYRPVIFPRESKDFDDERGGAGEARDETLNDDPDRADEQDETLKTSSEFADKQDDAFNDASEITNEQDESLNGSSDTADGGENYSLTDDMEKRDD